MATEKPTTTVPIHLSVSEPGRILAFEETPIYARVPGYVQEWKGRGHRRTVKEGQTLAVLSVPEMEVALAQKEAADQPGRRPGQAGAGGGHGRREGGAAAQEPVGAAGEGGDGGVLDADSIEESKYGYEAAQAKLEQRPGRRGREEGGPGRGRRRTGTMQKALLEFATLKAPYAGVVTQRNINRGDFVQPAAQAKGDPLFVVQQTDKVRVWVSVPESDADWVAEKCDASFRVQAIRGKEYTGPEGGARFLVPERPRADADGGDRRAQRRRRAAAGHVRLCDDHGRAKPACGRCRPRPW